MVPIERDGPERDALPPELERWRLVPVSIVVDLNLEPGQIDPAIRPLMPPGQQPRLFGRAVTALCEPPDFGAVLHALEVIQPGDVLVIAAGGDAHTAMIGEILCGHVRRLGGAGVVCDGAVRDVATLAGWTDLPVFARHVTPRGPVGTGRGAVNVPVEVGGATVSPGDLIIGGRRWLGRTLACLDPGRYRRRGGEAGAGDRVGGQPCQGCGGWTGLRACRG
jgi:4-hydroxy-4-methyl-2-oxoglutarate aldolase